MSDAHAAGDRPRYVLLAPSDNVVVLTRHVDPGDEIVGIADQRWRMATHLDAGNKLAARPIEAGQKVIKLGVSIGTATRDIAAGDHVHTHNLRSDYIPIDVKEAQHANNN
jgi:hypothetical protein